MRERGIEPVVIEYLATPPTAEELTALLRLLGLSARQLLRWKEARKEAWTNPCQMRWR
ncbi:MAG: hypothetical protein FD153_1290 [Rhodospirillaceae bacterium]|nr:MAG: hypothetical protein FD153_1290 [Rhodospirillaceae bacterium]